MNRLTRWCLLPCTLGILMSTPVIADEDRDQVYNKSTVYGWQMMSEQERNEYREEMRELKTEQERNEYRMEHHELMEERAKARGLDLHEIPMHRNDDMRPGTGMGPRDGMGSGGGMGGGGRR